MENRELTIATAPKRTSVRWENTYTTKQDLTAKAYEPHIIPLTTNEYHALPKAKKDNTKDIGGYVAGHLKNGQRRKGNIHARSLITLDIDNLPPTTNLPQHLASLPYAWLAHTTLSHTPQKPRWRLWIWTTRNTTPDEYEAISRRIAEDINPGLNWIDPTTFEPERFMYWPATLTDSDYQAHISTKKPTLNPDDILARYDTWTDLTTWPGITPHNTPTGTNKVETPQQKPGILGAFNRAHTIEQAIAQYLPDTYKPGTTKNRWTYTQGTSSNGLIIYNNGTLCYSQHATDPAADGHTHSAFDIVRIHTYGHLDTDTPETTPANKRPSYLAMLDLASEDPKTRKENAATTAKTINEVFTKQPPEPTTPTAQTDPPTITDWLDTLEPKKGGGFTDTISNYEKIFTHDPNINHIGWNSHSNQLEVQDPQALPWKQIKPGWTDNDDAQLKTYIANTYCGLYGPTKMHDALLSAASTRAFHPVRDYFNNLPPWDGIPRLDTLLTDTLGAEDTPYTNEVTRKTLVAAVRRTFKPGTKFDHVLTLVGPQGIGKSTIFAKLAGQWFSDSLTITDMKDKTGAEKLAGNLIVEISELAGMRKTEAEPVKGFISRTEDKYRPAYGRVVETYPRQCVIVGTTNAEDGFLRDPTGGRRWWPVHVTGNGAIKAHKLDPATIDQIWAEAKHLEKQGEDLYLMGTALEAAQQAQTDSVESDDRSGLVYEYLEKLIPNNWHALPLGTRRAYLDSGILPKNLTPHSIDGKDPFVKRTAVSKIEIWAECFSRDPDAMRRADSYDIAAIMQQLDGWSDSGKRERLPIYGRQRTYHRTLVHETVAGTSSGTSSR